MKKSAAGELTARLARWASTPIPGTPKILQRVRTGPELDMLEQGIRSKAKTHVVDPIEKGLRKARVDKAIGGAAELGGRVFGMEPARRAAMGANVGNKAVSMIANQPHVALGHALPFPGTGLIGHAIEHGKKFLLNNTPGLPVKIANGDMLQYFQDHPEKLKAKLERDKKKGKEKTARVMPYQQQTQWTCSAGCLKAVVGHHGIPLTEEQAVELIGTREGRGAEVDEITEGARKLGLEAFDHSFSSLEEAKVVLDQDMPIICDIQSFNNPGKGHYVVLVSISGNNALLMDPNTPGNIRVIKLAELHARWWDHKMAPPHELVSKWGVVILPPEV